MAIGPYGCGLERFCAAAGAALIFIIQPCTADFWAISKVHHLLVSTFFNWWAAAITVAGVSPWPPVVMKIQANLTMMVTHGCEGEVYRYFRLCHGWCSPQRQRSITSFSLLDLLYYSYIIFNNQSAAGWGHKRTIKMQQFSFMNIRGGYQLMSVNALSSVVCWHRLQNGILTNHHLTPLECEQLYWHSHRQASSPVALYFLCTP